MIKAGRLRHKVTIEECVQIADGQGGRSTEFFPVGRVFVSIRQATSEEVFNAGRQNNVITHMITARFTRLINEKARLIFKGTRIFNVVTVDNRDEINRELTISVREAR